MFIIDKFSKTITLISDQNIIIVKNISYIITESFSTSELRFIKSSNIKSRLKVSDKLVQRNI